MKALQLTIISLFSLISIFSDGFAKSEHIIVGYYANWRDVPFISLPVHNVTVINYAFALLENDGSIKLLNNKDSTNFQDISKLKKRNPDLKVLLAIGGWTLSKNFSKIASNTSLTQKFANNIKNLMIKYPGLDGVDIDWEYPVSGGDNIPHTPDDKKNYLHLVKEIRTTLDSISKKHYFITIAAPALNHLNGGRIDNIDVKKMLQYIDWINIMDYDFHGSTSEPTQTNNNAALFQSEKNISRFPGDDSVNDSIADYMKQNLSASEKKKLVLGIPLYGYAWQGVSANGPEKNHPGLYAAALGALPNPYSQDSDGVFTYIEIKKHLLQDHRMQRSWNEKFKFTTYYSPSKKTFLTFDDVQTVKAKTTYIKNTGLGGVMFWELSLDTFDKDSLVYTACLQLNNHQNTCTIPKGTQ